MSLVVTADLLGTEHDEGLHQIFQPAACKACHPGAHEPIVLQRRGLEVIADGPVDTTPGMMPIGVALEKFRESARRRVRRDVRPGGPQDEPDCSACGNRRFVRIDCEPGQPGFGIAIPCRACSSVVLATRRAERLLGSVPAEFREGTLQSLAERSREHAELVADLRTWIDDPIAWLLLHGDSGRGKTGLAIALGREMAATHSVLYTFVPVLLNILRSGFRNDQQADHVEQVMTAVTSVDLLILDDIGRHTITDYVREVLFRIVNSRWESRRRTIVVTKLMPADSPPEAGGRGGRERTEPRESLYGFLGPSGADIMSRILQRTGTDWQIDMTGMPNLRFGSE